MFKVFDIPLHCFYNGIMDDDSLNEFATLMVNQYLDRLDMMKTVEPEMRTKMMTLNIYQDGLFNSLLGKYEELDNDALEAISDALNNALNKQEDSNGFYNVGKGQA